MPEDFVKCVKNGGRVRTKSIGEGKYAHFCFLNGKSHMGEMHMKAKTSAKKMMKK